MPKYMTKQRKALLSYLSSHADEKLSAKQLEEALCCEGISISAVYRNLSELEKEGKVRYTEGLHCKECLHLSCEKCGKTYHMNSECAKILIENLAQSDEFAIDKASTVLYGVCRECQKQ